MSYIYDLDSKFYSALLATTELDIVDKNVADQVGEGKIPPDTHNRTILIGLGGTGVQTINHVKRVISSKLAPSWKSYIAFLAIDSDNNEFDNATHLTEEEFVRTTKKGIKEAVSKGRTGYPKAWLPFVEEDEAKAMTGFEGNGAGRKRLMGKMKTHYKLSGSQGVDEEIVKKLADRRNNILDNFAPNETGNYEVYVIGSVSGGTCSGSFLEMPALIHKALNAPARTHINAMLYLPDTLTALDSKHVNELMANGYASLKELDYYEGLKMRAGTEEIFYYNDPATPELKLKTEDDFFTMPYLIGTRSGATSTSKQDACDTIAEFFISILGRMVPPGEDAFMVDSFLNNALQHVGDHLPAEGNENMELDGTDHSRPKRYGTLGFAQAAAPEQIVKAYTISHACKLAGLEPISAQERTTRQTAGETMLPFYGEEQYYTAMEVNAARTELLEKMNDYMSIYQAAKFTYAATFGGNPTWDDLRSGMDEDAARNGLVNKKIEELTGSKAVELMKEQVSAQFQSFRNSVRAYVKQYGPMAFVNLFEGRAEKNDNGPRAVGILEALTTLRDDLDPVTNAPRKWPSAAEAKKAVDDRAKEIKEADGGFWGWAKHKINGFKDTQVDKWVTAYNGWVNVRIAEELRKHMLGTNGALNKSFIEPAQVLSQQLYTFGKLLEAMSEGYETYGKALNKYDDFAKINGGSAQVNIAALNPSVHAHLKQKAEKAAKTVEAEKVRNALVDSFFDYTAKWMEYDEQIIERKNSGTSISLVNSNSPISARYEFDRCLRQNMPSTVEVKVEELFMNANIAASDFANQIVSKLNAKSAPLFYGDLPENDTHRYMVYPQTLPQNLKDAIEQAARSLVHPDIQFYGTDYADSIMMYQMVAPFQMYKLTELKEWENQYLAMKNENKRGTGLHGRSPDLIRSSDSYGTAVYDQHTTWFDYPAITYSRDPKARDAVSGEISHEGKIRLDMDKVIAEAREKGILYSHKTHDGWMIKRVHLDKRNNWSFDETLLMPDDRTGALPQGKALLNEIVEQNNEDLNAFSKVVKLDFAGLLSKAHTEEKWAWEYASRVLYVHRKMFIEIRDTLELTKTWYDVVAKMNEGSAEDMYPAKMYRLIQAGILSQSQNGMWVLQIGGKKKNVANMSPNGLKVLRSARPKEHAIVDSGLTLYYLYTKLKDSCKDELGKMLDEAMVRVAEVMSDDDYIFSDEYVAADEKLSTTLAAEIEKITEMGADLGDDTNLKAKFVKNLEAKKITDAEQQAEILKFYSKIQLWENL